MSVLRLLACRTLATYSRLLNCGKSQWPHEAGGIRDHSHFRQARVVNPFPEIRKVDNH